MSQFSGHLKFFGVWMVRILAIFGIDPGKITFLSVRKAGWQAFKETSGKFPAPKAKYLTKPVNHNIMLEHQKFLLANISSIKHLFKKELKKSISWMHPEEIFELHRWVLENYWETHKNEISDVFTLA